VNTARARDHWGMKKWNTISNLLQRDDPNVSVSLIGAPVSLGSVTPGACDQAPGVLRAALRRMGTYDLESGLELALPVYDAGDLDVSKASPAECFALIRDAVADLRAQSDLILIIGGNNAITRPGVHGLGDLSKTGLITFDAHFDMRDTSAGLTNGNPVQALLDDGMPGENIAQIGLAPFANAQYMHDAARGAGNMIYTMSDIRAQGMAGVVEDALAALTKRCDRIYSDFDIDVIERGLAPGAPGARPGGITTTEFFAAARMVGAHERVAAVDLAEFDPSLDVSDVTALVAARWVAEILAGYTARRDTCS